MKYIELFKLKKIIGEMNVSTLDVNARIACYDFLDAADAVFTALTKYRAVTYNLPLAPNGKLDLQKFADDLNKSIKNENPELTNEEVIVQINQILAPISAGIQEEDEQEVAPEKLAKAQLNFLTFEQFQKITEPRTLSTKTFTPETGDKIEKIDWFLTADDERLLRKYLVTNT